MKECDCYFPPGFRAFLDVVDAGCANRDVVGHSRMRFAFGTIGVVVPRLIDGTNFNVKASKDVSV